MIVDLALWIAFLSFALALMTKQRSIVYVTVGALLVVCAAIIVHILGKDWKFIFIFHRGGTFGEDYAWLLVYIFTAYMLWTLLLSRDAQK